MEATKKIKIRTNKEAMMMRMIIRQAIKIQGKKRRSVF